MPDLLCATCSVHRCANAERSPHSCVPRSAAFVVAIPCRKGTGLLVCVTGVTRHLQANIVDVFLTPPNDPMHVEPLLNRIRTGTLHADLGLYLEARMAANHVLASSDSDETAHVLRLSNEYSRQGSVTQEAWDVSCDNLRVLLVDAGESAIAGDGELGSCHSPLVLLDHAVMAPYDAPQRTDASVVGSKRDLESCMTSQPEEQGVVPCKVCCKYCACVVTTYLCTDPCVVAHQAAFKTCPRGWTRPVHAGPMGCPCLDPSRAWHGAPAQQCCGRRGTGAPGGGGRHFRDA